MARAPFSIFNRPGKDGKTRFYARFLDRETGAVLRTAALEVDGSPVRSRAKAIMEAHRIHSEGLGLVKDNPKVLDYCLAAWLPDSEYVRSRALRGVKVSAQYVYINGKILQKHFAEYLKGVRLLDLTAARVERAMMAMAAAGVGPRTINTSLQALRVPIRYYCRLHKLQDPLHFIQPLREDHKERGVLSFQEVKALIALEDANPRVRAAVLLSALCGLRQGEVRGLQWADIDEPAGLIHVRSNYVQGKEGVKAPKWGSSRDVPLPAVVLESLKLCACMPGAEGSPFVLYGSRGLAAPVDRKTISKGLAMMLEDIGVSNQAQKERNLVFHSLRHTFVSMSRAAGLPDFVTQRLAGHRSPGMMERYSHAAVIDFQAAKEAMERAVAAGGEA